MIPSRSIKRPAFVPEYAWLNYKFFHEDVYCDSADLLRENQVFFERLFSEDAKDIWKLFSPEMSESEFRSIIVSLQVSLQSGESFKTAEKEFKSSIPEISELLQQLRNKVLKISNSWTEASHVLGLLKTVEENTSSATFRFHADAARNFALSSQKSVGHVVFIRHFMRSLLEMGYPKNIKTKKIVAIAANCFFGEKNPNLVFDLDYIGKMLKPPHLR